MESRRLLDELRIMEKGGGEMLDLGHPLLNRITDSFIKAAGVGAAQAVFRHAYAAASAQGEMNGKCFEALLKNTGKESLQWGLAAGMYSGITYGLKEATGTHDWKSSAVAGAVTGMAMSLTTDNPSNEKLVQSAITGAAISTVANLLGEMNGKCFEALLKNTGKESLQWGLAAGMYSGITYGLKEATGTHDWKSSAVAGAVTGMAMSLTTDNPSNEKLVQSAITGAAISTVANLLGRVF